MRSTACSTRGGAWWPSTSGQRPGRGSVTSSGCCASGQGGTMPNVSERCSARRASRHGRDGVHWSSCPGLRAGMEAACGARLASQVDGRLRCQRPGIDNPPHSLCTAVGFPRRPLGCEFGRPPVAPGLRDLQGRPGPPFACSIPDRNSNPCSHSAARSCQQSGSCGVLVQRVSRRD
jgi:hypothetical protein